jgi:hypothetical protein
LPAGFGSASQQMFTARLPHRAFLQQIYFAISFFNLAFFLHIQRLKADQYKNISKVQT